MSANINPHQRRVFEEGNIPLYLDRYDNPHHH